VTDSADALKDAVKNINVTNTNNNYNFSNFNNFINTVGTVSYSSLPDDTLTSTTAIPIGCPRIGRPSDYSQVQTGVQNAINNFDSTISGLLQNSNIQGLHMIIVQDQTVLYNKGFGVSQASGNPPTNSTIFRYGAITTLFTYLMVLKMRQDGILNYHDYFSKFCPVFPIINPFNNDSITIREMASHLSGLPKSLPYSTTPPCTPYNCSIANSDALQLLNGTQLLFPPLLRPSYSELAYSLLGRFLPSNLNPPQSYEQYITNNFIIPANLVDTVFNLNASQQSRLAQPFNESGLPISGTPIDANLGWNAPRGQLYGTNNDLATLMSSLFNSQDNILNANSKNDLFLPLIVNSDGKTMYGTPFEMLFYKNTLLRMIRGDMAGYSSHIIFIPELKLGVSVLSNTNADLSIFSLPIISALLDVFNSAVTNTTFILPTDYAKYVGTYFGSDNDGTTDKVVVQVLNGQLALNSTSLPAGVYILLEYIPNTENFVMHVRKDQGIISCLEFYGLALNYDIIKFSGLIPAREDSLYFQGLRFNRLEL